jgi:hypothetical protein
MRDATAAGAPVLAEVTALLGILPHLLLFPVVAALPAPGWARAAGWSWLAIDMATDIMGLNGVPAAIYLPLKYGGHLSAALWIATASAQAPRGLRIAGLLLALDLAAYSFLAPFVPVLPLLPSLVLLPLWFWLVGRRLAAGVARPPVLIEVSGPPAAR